MLDEFYEDGNAVVAAGFVARRRAFRRKSVDTHVASTVQLLVGLQMTLSKQRHVALDILSAHATQCCNIPIQYQNDR